MAPLSVLPGRVRFEASCLLGCKEGCHLLEERMLAMPGVIEASASHRTGTVLVRFDEGLVSRSEIEGFVKKALAAAAAPGERTSKALPLLRKSPASGVSSSPAGHFFMEVALHALLPAPLDFLLPVAATAFRR